MSYPISSCSVFIQVWVDTNAIQADQTTGVYLVDNRTSAGSQNEGSAGLQTACTSGSNLCWTVQAIDPNFVAEGGVLGLQSIGNSNAWGDSGQPESINSTTFTGQVQNDGTAGYSLNLNVQVPGGSGKTLTVSPGVIVS
jgi:hypothetical protein